MAFWVSLNRALSSFGIEAWICQPALAEEQIAGEFLFSAERDLATCPQPPVLHYDRPLWRRDVLSMVAFDLRVEHTSLGIPQGIVNG
jgi:hypothetical protein